MENLKKNVEDHKVSVNTLLSEVGISEAFNDDKDFFELINNAKNLNFRFVFNINKNARMVSVIMGLCRLLDVSKGNRICLIKTIDSTVQKKDQLIAQAKKWPIDGSKEVADRIQNLIKFSENFKNKNSRGFSKIKKLKSFRDSFLAHKLINEREKRIIFREVGFLIKKVVSIVGNLHFCVLESEKDFAFSYKTSYKRTEEYIRNIKRLLGS